MWATFDPVDNYFYRLLSKRYAIELTEQPDFLIHSWSQFGSRYQQYSCVRIYYTGENERPDFTACDYAFSFDHLDDPRHYRLPLYVLYFDVGELVKTEFDPRVVLAEKTSFCNFIYSNPRCLKRNRFFQKLSKYKRVDSGGRFLNNIGGPVQDKAAFMRRYKFTIAFENQSAAGYTTEKLVEPMRVNSIPIYWGNPLVHLDFNARSFLNYHDAGSDEALIERIIEVDRDDDLYFDYLRQPWLHGNQAPAALSDESVLDRFEEIFAARITPVALRRRSVQWADNLRRLVTRRLPFRARQMVGTAIGRAVQAAART